MEKKATAKIKIIVLVIFIRNITYYNNNTSYNSVLILYILIIKERLLK